MTPAERDAQVRTWIEASPDDEALIYNNVVMWGVCFNLNDETDPPVALFGTKEEANAYATLCDKAEWHVGPYVMALVGRNSIDIPEPA